jgi:hypothetical protein
VKLDEPEPGHPDEVGVEGRQRRVVIRGERGDEEIGDAEPLSGIPGRIDPFVDPRPRCGTGLEHAERGQGAPEDGASTIEPL